MAKNNENLWSALASFVAILGGAVLINELFNNIKNYYECPNCKYQKLEWGSKNCPNCKIKLSWPTKK